MTTSSSPARSTASRAVKISPADRRVRLVDRSRWLEDAIARTEVRIKKTPWFFSATILAIPLGLIWGTFAAILAICATFGVGFTIGYIEWVHKREYEIELDTVLEEIDRSDADSATVTKPPVQDRA